MNAQRISQSLFGVLMIFGLDVNNAFATDLEAFLNPSGAHQTHSTTGPIDRSNPFFQSLGSNGRSCVSCHQPSEGWTITPAGVRNRLVISKGNDPIFRPVDGSNCRNANPVTFAQKVRAYSLLLNKGLIRVNMDIPQNADFSLVKVEDPYQCQTEGKIAMYRRPLPTANLRFLSAVMWDGRETTPGTTIEENLFIQARDATLGHAEAKFSPTDEQLKQIVDFEMALFTAQVRDNRAGSLMEGGALGGPKNLSQQNFFIGINDPLMNGGTGFSEKVMIIFNSWMTRTFASSRTQANARTAIARGQEIFNSKKFVVADVKGLNDVLKAPAVTVTCTVCHDSPGAGSHSVPFPVDIGLTTKERRTADLPLYTFRCASGEIIQTTDPGRAMVTGKCSDMNKFKGPVLRGLASRAPYFHDGSAATPLDVVEFYNKRFDIGLTTQEKVDLTSFLQAL